MNNRFELPSDHELRKQMIISKSAIDEKKADLGLLGRFFGSQRAAPVYGSILIALGIAISLVYVLVFSDMSFEEKKGISTILAGIILPVMGYLFGRSK